VMNVFVPSPDQSSGVTLARASLADMSSAGSPLPIRHLNRRPQNGEGRNGRVDNSHEVDGEVVNPRRIIICRARNTYRVRSALEVKSEM
jgi:hypothetical protein